MAPNSENSTIETPVEEINPDSNTFIVKYRKNYYDITQFLHKHPGGINTLRGLQNSDMTSRFMKAPPHSDAAMYLMKEYQMKTQQMMTKPPNGERVIKHIKENIEIIEEEDYVADKTNNNNINALDESMEATESVFTPITVFLKPIPTPRLQMRTATRKVNLCGDCYYKICSD